jgi:putative transposase
MPGVPHHITQRGTDRQTVFFARRDRRVYLELLREQARGTDLRILAYCLMRNHIHLIAVPGQEDSLAIGLRRAHGRYAQYLNARRGRTGHLWQNRFFSCPLEGAHLSAALRYVERNPVRAMLVSSPEDYVWSSAPAHLMGKDPTGLLDMRFWEQSGGLPYWMQLIHSDEDESARRDLRKATYAGRPLGSVGFVETCKRPPIQAEAEGRERRGAA